MEHLLTDTAPIAWGESLGLKFIQDSILFLPIAHELVKKVPILSVDEQLIDLKNVHQSRLIPMSSVDTRYENTYDDFSKVRPKIYQLLLDMLELLPKNIGIAYFEGFRPLWKQKEYFDKKFKETLAIIPNKIDAYHETTKSISPFIDNIPVHCTGAAIDMTLFSIESGRPTFLDMGMFDVIFGENHQQETFSENTTVAQRDNRSLLIKTALNVGFVNYGYEWWHFSYGDKAWAHVKQQPAALYDILINQDDAILEITLDDYLA